MLIAFRNDRFRPALLLPNTEYVRSAATGTFADIDKAELFQHGAITRIRNTAAGGGIQFNAGIAGI